MRTLGYGGAIHHYKNYVLRGKEKYFVSADKSYASAMQIVERMKGMNGLSPEENKALSDIGNMINQYRSSLPTIKEIYASEKSLFKVLKMTDDKVKIDDGPAKAGLKILRDKKQFNALENLEYTLGYGNAIHNFKNYIIRGKDKYRNNADLLYTEAETWLTKLEKNTSDPDMTKALGIIRKTVKGYHKALPKIAANYKKLEGVSSDAVRNVIVRGSDRLVKINDSAT
ncbi:MAG: hypothetical protein IME94_11050, partial [Proteobacteria bacterium]|nr:hypothetical protein [Pseudomonadota bacterium]